ncbi:zinc finger protein 184-like [Cydia strobilella]|uniref:zinc finger protein 184-like n=1 Tax=Cydia strobilella TaxID=1100964 RepID=UPI003006768C
MEGVSAEVRVKEETDWEHSAHDGIVLLPVHKRVKEEPLCSDMECKGTRYEQDKARLVLDHGQYIADKVKEEIEQVKDEQYKEPSCSDTGSGVPGLYAEQDKAELVPEQGQSILIRDKVANEIVSAKQDPLHQHQSPESHAGETADQRKAVAGPSQDIDEIFECETCGKTFNQIFFLTSHMQLHKYNFEIVETETKTYSCDTCEKQFATKKLLYEHELTHIAHEYPCEICGKTFSFLHQLTNHTRVHTGEKPYKCTMCTKQYAWHTTLARHERRHNEEKPHVWYV